MSSLCRLHDVTALTRYNGKCFVQEEDEVQANMRRPAGLYLVATQEDIYTLVKRFWVLFLVPSQVQLVDKLLQAIAAHLLLAGGRATQHVGAGNGGLLVCKHWQLHKQLAAAQKLIQLQSGCLDPLLSAVAEPIQDELHVLGNCFEASDCW